jgi:hypothetical protein
VGARRCGSEGMGKEIDIRNIVWFADREHGSDTGYRAVPELPEGEDDYDEHHNYPHCPAFKQIGDLRGPFDLGLIPIGAYNPRW